MSMFRIKCSNGKYVQTTRLGTFVTFTKNGRIFHSKNLVNKNLGLCVKFSKNARIEEYEILTYEIETLL